MSTDQAQSPRIGQPTSPTTTYVQMFDVDPTTPTEDLVEAAWPGMLVYRIDTSQLYVFDATLGGWRDVAGGVPGHVTYVGPSQPATGNQGDTWYDNDDGYKEYVYDGGWKLATPPVIKTFRQPAPPPVSVNVGDLWFDTTLVSGVPKNLEYRANAVGVSTIVTTGNGWYLMQDLAIATAQGTADGKIKSYYQTTRPWPDGTAGHALDDGDLWYDTTIGVGGTPKNTPYYWKDSTKTWTLAQDFDITVAQTTANGKNKVTYSTSVPGSTPNTIGDLWYQYVGTLVKAQYRGAGGTSWTQTTMDSTVLTNLDAGAITTGFLAAARLQAQSITTDKLVIGGVNNWIANGGFENGVVAPHVGAGGSTLAASSTQPSHGAVWTGVITLGSTRIAGAYAYDATFGGPTLSANGEHLAVSPGEVIYGEIWVRSGSAAGMTVRAYIDAISSTGTRLSNTADVGTQNSVTVSSTYTKCAVQMTMPTGAAYASLNLAYAGCTAGQSNIIDDAVLTKMVTGTLIVNGTIDTENLKATAIDGMTVTGALIQTASGSVRRLQMTVANPAYGGGGGSVQGYLGLPGAGTETPSYLALGGGTTFNPVVILSSGTRTYGTGPEGLPFDDPASITLTTGQATGSYQGSVAINGELISMLADTFAQQDFYTYGTRYDTQPCAYRYRSSNLTVADSTITVMDFGTSDSPGTGITDSSGLFTVPTPGTYLVNAFVTWDTASTVGRRQVSVYQNSTQRGVSAVPGTAISGNGGVTITYVLKCAGSDTISIRVYQTSGGNLATLGGQTNCWLQIYMLG